MDVNIFLEVRKNNKLIWRGKSNSPTKNLHYIISFPLQFHKYEFPVIDREGNEVKLKLEIISEEGRYWRRSFIWARTSVDTAVSPYKPTHDEPKNNFVGLGTGTTPTTLDTYELESPFAYFDITNISVTYDWENRQIVVLKTGAWENNTGETKEIHEIGLYYKLWKNASEVIEFLVDRSVIETPIEVKPNESVTITYKIVYTF